jgi:hypothetical protein
MRSEGSSNTRKLTALYVHAREQTQKNHGLSRLTIQHLEAQQTYKDNDT